MAKCEKCGIDDGTFVLLDAHLLLCVYCAGRRPLPTISPVALRERTREVLRARRGKRWLEIVKEIEEAAELGQYKAWLHFERNEVPEEQDYFCVRLRDQGFKVETLPEGFSGNAKLRVEWGD